MEKEDKNMDWDMVVCYCMNVTNGMIKEAVENGATTLEKCRQRPAQEQCVEPVWKTCGSWSNRW